MSKPTPVVYVLHGEDSVGIAQFVAQLRTGLGDPSMVEMNTVRLEGETLTMEQLRMAAGAMPFLANRRLVILTHPVACLSKARNRDEFAKVLESSPASAAVVLIEPRILTAVKDKDRENCKWLEKWARGKPGYVHLQAFPLPSLTSLTGWIEKQTRQAGGKIDPKAADLLASRVGQDTEQLVQEIHKLLAYVNYERPVEVKDVDYLTVDSRERDIFSMVDAMGNMNAKIALDTFHHLLDERGAEDIFWMVIRQFRLLLLSREILDNGGNAKGIAQSLKLHPFVAEKISMQARGFSMESLDEVYHRLLGIDAAVKTGQVESDVALDTFITSLTH